MGAIDGGGVCRGDRGAGAVYVVGDQETEQQALLGPGAEGERQGQGTVLERGDNEGGVRAEDEGAQITALDENLVVFRGASM